MNVADEIEKLAKLRDRGVISDEEFQKLKVQILGTEKPSSVDDKDKNAKSKPPEGKIGNETEALNDNANAEPEASAEIIQDNVLDKNNELKENINGKGNEEESTSAANTNDTSQEKPEKSGNSTTWRIIVGVILIVFF